MMSASALRTLDELHDRLDLHTGDIQAKRSAFWTMLALSGVIATAGVITDSTATVIGAMIIAPLSTPILGMALGVVTGSIRLIARSAAVVAFGALVVVVIGLVGSAAMFDVPDIMQNSQISSRTSPRIMDLVAAIATGLAGSFAIARRDLGDVLPGVAIAISLVPPLAVAGVCFGSGDFLHGLGALLLFLSNVAALITACVLVLAISGYTAAAQHDGAFRRGHAYLAVGAFLVVVAIPITVNTVTQIVVAKWVSDVRTAATIWIADTPRGHVEKVDSNGARITVDVRSPDLPPPLEVLMSDLERTVPSWLEVTIVHTQGERIPE
ncbi:putative hydrophobic protein (TIGR00271 family) [Hoyosella altamirensis]|uniref:Putative hydrophobic protein (TIGR00271 family) n=2 Tax=Hoyosella altamirensis TaxID=616997 RepID=A0A839RUS2_9ACTN|nr:putative hydrophobic protein (TIGR00271 family) [Hoyosella altamirensis]